MSKDKTNQKGITLIALVITIIVMLILVGVSVTVALNGALFTTAKEAAEGTAAERDNELALSDGKVTINGEEYNSINEYVNGSGNGAGEQKVAITPKKETYTIGEEVTIGEETFYVIADDTEKVTLLAKDCIVIDQTNAEYLKQSINAGRTGFSTEAYWGSGTSPYDIVETTPIPDSHTAAKAAYDYGAKIGGAGRLMIYSEATALETANSDILYGTNGKSSSSSLEYWLGSAYGSNYVWLVSGSTNQIRGDGTYNNNLRAFVRPVVEISKSDIS